MKRSSRLFRTSFVLQTLAILVLFTSATAQQGQQAPPIKSPEVSDDRMITFRISAPKAGAVRLSAGDIPGMGAGKALTKNEKGVWEITVGPVPAGSFRYVFNVDGVNTMDPRNPQVSESNENSWSLVHVKGAEYSDTTDVPRGAVAAVTYYSKALGKFRRMHIYTPPGYELGTGKYPVFYLLHGAGDCDDSWTSVGRAGFILDNLIAAKKAKPMIIVMPAGHVGPLGQGPIPGIAQPGSNAPPPVDPFIREFMNDIMPYAESHYRVLPGRQNRAIAGLSMGGNHTLNIALPNLERFGYIGVFSSGLLNVFSFQAAQGAELKPTAAGQVWLDQNHAKLDDPNLKKGLKLLWVGIGKEDFLLRVNNATLDLLKKKGFNPTFHQTDGGHTWLNWRAYLGEFAPQLFQSK